MNVRERLSKILHNLQQHGQVQVRELAQELGVSEMTIRRDLERLAREGHLVRTYGGATAAAGLIHEQPFAAKAVSHTEEKERIGRAAAALVRDGDVVLLDAGSTTLATARCLKGRKRLTVITVDLRIALELCDEPGIEVIVTGGTVAPEIYNLMGPVTEQFLRGVTVNIAFIGTSSADVDYGLTTPTLAKVPLKRLMIQAAQQAVLVTDSSKFNRRATYHICKLSALSRVITDRGLPAEAAAAIRKGGIPLDLV